MATQAIHGGNNFLCVLFCSDLLECRYDAGYDAGPSQAGIPALAL